MNEDLAKNNSDVVAPDYITATAAHLALVEVAMGTAIHAVHLPFGGHLLSLNEGMFLARASSRAPSRLSAALACYEIAGVASALKSLSPASKKLGPMLSIVMQGLLFALGVLIGGRRRLGQFLGFALLSTWAFAQPFVTLLVSFGLAELTQVLQFYQDRLAKDYPFVGANVFTTVFSIIAGLYFLKCLAAAAIVIWLEPLDDSKWLAFVHRWQDRARSANAIGVMSERTNRKPVSAWRGALRDLRQPLFVISFALTMVFLFVQKESLSKVIWISLRPLGIAFLIFYLLRAQWFVVALDHLTRNLSLLRPVRRRFDLVRNYFGKLTT